MTIGTSVTLPAYNFDPAFVAQKAEELGFDSIWYAEHPILPVHSESPFPNHWVTLEASHPMIWKWIPARCYSTTAALPGNRPHPSPLPKGEGAKFLPH